MNITQSIENTVNSIPEGEVFGYQKFTNYIKSPNAVIKAINRMVTDNKLQRLSKGQFYIPKRGLLGLRKPSDNEIVRSIINKNGRITGYITGLALFNQLGLTTQMPFTITVACNGGRQIKRFGTIQLRMITTKVPLQKNIIPLLQYLDVLKDIKKIPDADINLSLKIMAKLISALSETEQNKLLKLAIDFYSPQVKALIGLLYTSQKLSVPNLLKNSLNPTTLYKLNIDDTIWPNTGKWNIQ